ncbi:hypothetical protein PI124_g12614 [Phytophthora idaei]|nr:hypothetical protein PI125_g6882 [Phytophthora idaei]KAG3161480.1 hypothetical protein PI126_g6431 [Phytophthora idaei]KAG3242545.1 hypothetical protein PI124_g12614 [Phytophthora idaei]
MKCAYADCENLELSITDPCSICHHPVYHLCSNGLFDPDNIALRAACVTEWKTKNQPAETAVADDQRVTFEIVGWTTDCAIQHSVVRGNAAAWHPSLCGLVWDPA